MRSVRARNEGVFFRPQTLQIPCSPELTESKFRSFRFEQGFSILCRVCVSHFASCVLFFFFFHPSGAEVYCVQRYKNSLFPPPPSTKRNEKEIFVDRVKRFAFFHFLFSSSSVFHSLSLFFISKRYVFRRPSEKFSIIQRLFASLF